MQRAKDFITAASYHFTGSISLSPLPSQRESHRRSDDFEIDGCCAQLDAVPAVSVIGRGFGHEEVLKYQEPNRRIGAEKDRIYILVGAANDLAGYPSSARARLLFRFWAGKLF